MPTFDEILRDLETLRKSAGDPEAARKEGFAEGFRTAHNACTEAVRAALASVVREHSAKPVAPTPHPQQKSPSGRLSAPTKDQLVRDYLISHPGTAYRDLNRELGTYVATRVYALEKRGEVTKDEEGRFHLIPPDGAPDAPNSDNPGDRERLP